MKTKTQKTKKPATSSKKGTARTAYEPNQRISVLVKANPRREGTAAHKRYAVLLKQHGKTVGVYLEKGGRMRSLKRAVVRDEAKVA